MLQWQLLSEATLHSAIMFFFAKWFARQASVP